MFDSYLCIYLSGEIDTCTSTNQFCISNCLRWLGNFLKNLHTIQQHFWDIIDSVWQLSFGIYWIFSLSSALFSRHQNCNKIRQCNLIGYLEKFMFNANSKECHLIELLYSQFIFSIAVSALTTCFFIYSWSGTKSV